MDKYLTKNTNFFQLSELFLPVFIGIIIFVNPFPHITAIKEISFYTSLCMMCTLMLFKKIKFSFKTPLLLPFMLFAIWVCIGIFFAVDKGNSIHDAYAHMLKYFILFYLIINFFKSDKHIDMLSNIFIISSALFSFGGLFYYYYILNNNISSRFALGFTEIPTNLIGIVSIPAILFSLNHLSRKIPIAKKFFYILCMFPLIAASLSTQSRGTLIALIVGISIFFIRHLFKTMFILLPAIALFLVLSPFQDPFTTRAGYAGITHNIRIGMNYITFEILKDYPITGIGFGMETYRKKIDWDMYNHKIPLKYQFSQEDKINNWTTLNDPHNMLLSIAVRTGVIGFILFLLILSSFINMCIQCSISGKNIFIKNWGRCIGAAFASFFVIGIFEPVFSTIPETVLCTLFSMIAIVWNMNNNSSYYLDSLLENKKFHFCKLVITGIDNTPVLRVINPKTAEEETCLFNQNIPNGDTYLEMLHHLIADRLSKRNALPVVRFADGEYSFYKHSLRCNGLYQQAESVRAIKNALPAHIEALKIISKTGIFAPLIYPGNSQHKQYSLLSLIHKSKVDDSAISFLELLYQNHIELNNDNFIPFYGVYAYLTSKQFFSVVHEKKICIINSEYNSDSCHHWFARFSSYPNISFVKIPEKYIATQWISIKDKYLNQIPADTNLCLVGAGVGALLICADISLKFSIPAIDSGHILNLMNDREKKSAGSRLYTIWNDHGTINVNTDQV